MTEQPSGPTEQSRDWLDKLYLKKFAQTMRTPPWADETEKPLKFEIVRELTEADLVLLREVDQHIRAKRLKEVPAICEWLMCMTVEPEFQEDRLADYQERFDDLWLPKFGRRAAVAIYVWHVLRQSRLIDWLIRVFGWGDPL